MTNEREQRYGKAIWETSRRDEGTISVTGANIVARAVMAVADEELAMYKRGGKTLGETIDWQCRAVLDATGMHHVIGEDGDGDWALVWEHLAELRPRLDAAEAKLRRVEELAHWWESLDPNWRLPDPGTVAATAIRKALDGAA